jgi:transposase
MNLQKDILPDNIEELKGIVFSYKSAYDTLHSENRILQNKLSKTELNYKILQEKFKAAMGRFFSPKKEKVSFEQLGQPSLFNETETYTEKENEETSEDAIIYSSDEVTVKSHPRKKGGKRRIPDYVPAEEIVYELDDEEKGCKCCGKARPVIGEDRSEELDIIPAHMKKVVHIVKKYGPCTCDDFLNLGEPEVVRAVKPERFIPYSIASAGLIAYSIDYKYNYAMPYYRLSRNFDALGIDISRATLCNWTMLAAEKCRIIYDMMFDLIRKSEIINMDETRVQVLHEDGKTAESLSYMWVMKGGLENKKLTVFHYEPSRSSKTPLKLLDGFKGYLQTDGYEGYSKAVIEFNLVHVGCLAHIRRKFIDAHKTNKESKTAKSGIIFISKIYNIENKLRKKELPPGKFVEKRKDEMRPVLDEFKIWLDEISKSILPSSEPGKAVNYALNQWDKFINFLEHPDLTPDNNTIENAIRPFAVGRKNWLFSNTPRGAESSAIMYSLVESAKNNNLGVYNYLRYLFTNLPNAKSAEEIEKLLPCNLSPGDVKID